MVIVADSRSLTYRDSSQAGVQLVRQVGWSFGDGIQGAMIIV